MSRYEIKDEYQREVAQEVRLTGFTSSSPEGTTIIGTNLANEISQRDENKQLNVSYSDEKREKERFCWNRRWLCQRLRRSFKTKLLYRRIPILDWLPRYRSDYVVSDLVAGITVGLTVIPQAIAYANVAGIPPQYGLYSSFMACFVYTIFGSSKDVPVGPTAIAAILTRETLTRAHVGPNFAVLLAFMSGVVSLLMGILQLGFLIDFISGPVSVGFTSAAAIIIATSQIKDVLGIRISGGNFLDTWHNVFEHICDTRIWDTIWGLISIAVLLILRKVKDIPLISRDTKVTSSTSTKIMQAFLWFLSTSRNILIVVVSAVACWYLENHLGSSPVILTGHVKEGLPSLQLPPFTTTEGNVTYNFIDMVSALGSGCIVVPLLSLLESIALAKVFSDGKPIDATQEMLAIGLCNLLSSFVSSMPVSGGLSRGAVNHSSGVKTTLGGVYTGILVLVSLQFFTPYLYYIPKCALAAVIIAAVLFMVEFHVIKPMWRTKKIDLVPAAVTFICCLFVNLELGIVIGIGVNLLFLLYASARPSLKVMKMMSPSGCEYLLITPDRSLSFPSVEYVRAMISKHGTRLGNNVPVVIDSTHIQAADFTAAKGIKNLIQDFFIRGQPLIFLNLKPSIIAIFQGVKPSEMWICSSETELNDSLRDSSTISAITVTRH
ncbi:sodium-independent sulfate anion transporter isoform X1 [Diachasma alloeum]|uniref:sodium-independent sulfate anion transporter isoform X1 n=1 Tax=Diachasma alloeum TaxID=454923 RepID=UPI00073835C0|nr:sodium-independent sulfate anion transporter isoform X1 [Diachasma alloeum]